MKSDSIFKTIGKIVIKITAVVAIFAAINVLLAKLFKKAVRVSIELDDVNEDDVTEVPDEEIEDEETEELELEDEE